MPPQPIRVGIVGAGANTRLRHIPGFRGIDGVEIVAVANRTPESTERVAREFDIPRTFDTWQSLVTDDDIDAVLVGTWPNLHCEVTCAALDAGKHVLTEARMARDLAEAQQMLAASEKHSDLVTQVVPSPFGLECGPAVRRLLDDNFIGELRELVVIGVDDMFRDYSQPLHWRQDAAISGKNVLSLGILHETALRWTPPPVRVMAQTATFEPTRPKLDESRYVDVTVPDSVHVMTQLENGGRGLYHMNGVLLFGPGRQIHMYGSRGTIKVEFGDSETIRVGHSSDTDLRQIEIPDDLRGSWRVEEEFVAAIRGEDTVRLNDFATALRYMEFTEAVAESAESGAAVTLPQPD
ncbi:MAG: Gfo/Idh/MocA family protein [Maioricimonas sp. JB049]